MKIGIIGLGFVGLTFAVVLASKGHKILGIDSNKDKILNIKAGKIPFYEPKLEFFLKKALKNSSLSVSSNIEGISKYSDIIFVTIGTPLTDKNKIDLSHLKSVAKKIGKDLIGTRNIPIIVIKSTVTPNTTRKIVLPIIEKNSKKKVGKGFDLVTNPEFLQEGKAIDDTINPHIVVIGCEEKSTINKIKRFYNGLYKKRIPIIISNYETAEMIKYANNSFLATKISFINQIANICQKIPGTNIDDIANAIGVDPRIGNLFLKAGPGYGGSCFPKDIQALISYSEEIGENSSLLKAVQKTNKNQINNVINLIKKNIGNIKNKEITILGLAFKENTDDIRESISIKLIKLLLDSKVKVKVHDPMAIENTKLVFGNKIHYYRSVNNAIRKSDCLVIMTPWKQYKKISKKNMQSLKNKLIIDTRRILDKNSQLNCKYIAIGHGN